MPVLLYVAFSFLISINGHKNRFSRPVPLRFVLIELKHLVKQGVGVGGRVGDAI